MATTTFVRADNSIGYFLPANLGGFYGQVMVAAAENGTGHRRPSRRYVGGQVGFAAGPFDVAFAAAEQRNAPVLATQKQKTYNLGGAYDFGFLKLMGYIDRDTAPGLRETRGSISAVVPMGQGEIHVGYDRSKLRNSVPGALVHQHDCRLKATYVYNLSKRTAMYGTISRLTKDTTALSAPGASSGTRSLRGRSGGKSKGFELGVRHFF